MSKILITDFHTTMFIYNVSSMHTIEDLSSYLCFNLDSNRIKFLMVVGTRFVFISKCNLIPGNALLNEFRQYSLRDFGLYNSLSILREKSLAIIYNGIFHR